MQTASIHRGTLARRDDTKVATTKA